MIIGRSFTFLVPVAALVLALAGLPRAAAQQTSAAPADEGSYRERYTALTQENEYLRKRLDEVERGEGDEAEAENLQLRAEIEDLKTRLRKAKEDTDELCRLIEEGKKDAQGLADLKSRAAVLEGENAALKKAVADAGQHKARADKAEADLASAKKELEQLKAGPAEAPAAPPASPAQPAAESGLQPRASHIFAPVPLERVAGLKTAANSEIVALMRQGVAAEQKGNYTGALKAYEQAAAKNASYIEATKARARCLLNLGRAEDAVKLMQPAAAKAPQDMQVQLLYGIGLCSTRKFRESVDALKIVVMRDLSDARARAALGVAWMGLGALKAARLELEKSLELDPQLTDAHYNLAKVLFEGSPSEREQARMHYQAALQLGAKPDHEFEKKLRGF